MVAAKCCAVCRTSDFEEKTGLRPDDVGRDENCWPVDEFPFVWFGYLFSLAESPTAFCEMMKNGFGRWPALFTSANTISQIGRMMHIYGYLIVGLGCPARRVRPYVPICLPRSPIQRTRWAGKTKNPPPSF